MKRHLKDVLNGMNLSLPVNYPEVYTYRHGSGKSIIDYIIHNKSGLVKSVYVVDEHCNTSPHSAVAATIPYVQSVAINTEEIMVNTNKLKWDKVDKVKYKDLVEERLSDRNLLDVENDNINLVVEDLTDILVSTANQCAPQQKRKRSKCKSKGWNSDISHVACRDSKATFQKCKDSGRPVDPNNQTYVEMKRKKKVLGQIQRQLAAKHRFTLYNEIMSYAESPDSVNFNTEKKLFFINL